MSIVMQINPFEFFADTQGDALDSGYVWIGQPNSDPRQYPITVYYDAELTIPAPMPLRTSNGYIVRNGAPTFLYAGGNYSILVEDKKHQQIYYVADFLMIGSASAAPVGNVERMVSNIAELRALVVTAGSTMATTKGYYAPGDGGGSSYWLDSLDVSSVDNGGTVIVAVDGSRWKLVLKDIVTVKQFGAKGDGSTDDTARIHAARNWMAAQSDSPQLAFTTGAYAYSVSPNWAIQDSEVICKGEVKLRYTGTGNAVIFDADAVDAVGPLPGTIYNVQFGGSNRFIIESPPTAGHAVFVRSVHHSKIRTVVRGCGITSAALKVNFAVLTEFDIVASGNEVGVWYLGGKPAEGLNLDQRGVGETTSYCYFPNPIIEGPDVGIHLVNTLGNIFMGGASEGCSTFGVLADSTAQSDKFIGTDFEVNTTADVFCQGLGIEFINCDSSGLITFGTAARRCLLTGGQHQNIDLNINSLACRVLHTTYNRFTSTGTFNDASATSTVVDVRNASGTPALASSVVYDGPNIPIAGVATTTIGVGGARLGDGVFVSSSINLPGLIINAQVTAENVVTVFLTNISGVAVDPPSTILRAWIMRQGF